MKQLASQKRLIFIIAGVISFAVFAWFGFSRLAFSPVPWPDGSAFYLPSLGLLGWPPVWKMHSQAAFVPSYDIANFNMMPLLPGILGVMTHLGLAQLLGGPLAIKVVSLGALFLAAWTLWMWLWKISRSLWLATVVGLAFLLDPTLRWGTWVVRSEIWIGLIWVGLLRELSYLNSIHTIHSKNRSLWTISALLAASAWIHFEAIILVPATAVGLFQLQKNRGKVEWIRSCVQVGLRTSLFLLPWGAYVLSNFSIFLDQMQTQFHRLAHGNFWVSTPYLLFHSLFLDLGSPESVPKFFNLGKGLFWLCVIGLTFWTAFVVSKPDSDRNRHPWVSLPVLLAGGVAFWTSFYLWVTKPEIWFITLCHATLWPWVGLVLIRMKNSFPKNALQLTVLGYAVISFLASIGQQKKIHPSFSWPVYGDWVSCIERTVSLAAEKKNPKIWQPHVPDILVELSYRHSAWDLTRTLDFDALKEKSWKFTTQVDALVMSRYLSPRLNEVIPPYEGPERPSDQKLVENEVDQPFGSWILTRLPAEQPGQWERRVCQVGPFFADVAVRVVRAPSNPSEVPISSLLTQ